MNPSQSLVSGDRVDHPCNQLMLAVIGDRDPSLLVLQRDQLLWVDWSIVGKHEKPSTSAIQSQLEPALLYSHNGARHGRHGSSAFRLIRQRADCDSVPQ